MHLSITDISAIHEVKVLIEKEYDCHYTIQQLAKRFFINESKLRKGFYQMYQINIYEFLVQVRIERAKALLEKTEHSINIIAAKIGYDIRNLEKQFRKCTGMLPLEWRKSKSNSAFFDPKTKTA